MTQKLKKRAALIGGLYRRLCPSLKELEAGAEFTDEALLLLEGGPRFQMVDYYEVFWLAERSAFLKGGGRGRWRADFLWLIRPANMEKVLDERYDTPLPALERKANRNMFRMYCESLEEE